MTNTTQRDPMDVARDLAESMDDGALSARLSMIADDIHNRRTGRAASFTRFEQAAFLDEAAARLHVSVIGAPVQMSPDPTS